MSKTRKIKRRQKKSRRKQRGGVNEKGILKDTVVKFTRSPKSTRSPEKRVSFGEDQIFELYEGLTKEQVERTKNDKRNVDLHSKINEYLSYLYDGDTEVMKYNLGIDSVNDGETLGRILADLEQQVKLKRQVEERNKEGIFVNIVKYLGL
jgi:hypothetical protein